MRRYQLCPPKLLWAVCHHLRPPCLHSHILPYLKCPLPSLKSPVKSQSLSEILWDLYLGILFLSPRRSHLFFIFLTTHLALQHPLSCIINYFEICLDFTSPIHSYILWGQGSLSYMLSVPTATFLKCDLGSLELPGSLIKIQQQRLRTTIYKDYTQDPRGLWTVSIKSTCWIHKGTQKHPTQTKAK